jgi:hypothetical protein
MILELPDAIADRLADLAQRRGFSSSTEFLVELVTDEGADDWEMSKDDIDRLLIESMEGGPSIPDSPKLRQRFRDRANGVL